MRFGLDDEINQFFKDNPNFENHLSTDQYTMVKVI
jgi:hypothetical protein